MSDDWFERALEDDEAAKAEAEAEREGKHEDERERAHSESDDDEREAKAHSPVDAESDDADSSEGSLFETSFGEALQNVPAPEMGTEGDSSGSHSDGSADPFTTETPLAGDSDSGPTPPEHFSAVDFDLEAPDEPDYDADVDSALSRIDLGVEGLDRMIQGGVPERSLMVAIGSAGTGKTTFGLQFLDHALEDGESAVFITLEESRQRVIDSATEKGFPFDEYVAEDRLAIVDLDPVEMTNSLASIRNELPRLIEDFDASRLVLDSVSLLEMMYDDRAKRRNEIYDFTRALKEAGVTTLLTSEAAEDTPYASRHGIVEYLTDAVFVMQYVRPDDFRETRLAIEIQKIRDANHSREKKPYELTDDGISVYQQANLF
ncbi:KaiC domain-containing protein [Natronolimnobius sp. AArcel1]|uniref:KaiC domain-containing protein n=1 Tax=Natronolimnobius sp. AArcel1 TaxID=1679093 RepID=UPI0013E9FC58|nr:KaiC domain-containing protein [Natronolimnobius sp. AArcel1]NGM68424.1 KaiC domain-containing protein [Natronolimnobius sp. AArcel1]